MKRSSDPFPKALEKLLEEHEVSKRELTRRVQRHGWGSLAAIQQLSHGDIAPTIKAMEAIATALQIRPEYFADYRLRVAQDRLDPKKVGLKAALRNLGE